MKIDFEMTYEEFSWVGLMTTRCNNVGYKVENVYRDDKGEICISLQPICLGEYQNVKIES
jgi:hypothetical protein